ncbi:MAG TPA: hypothetical protein VK791_08395 [bacterium]|nr:hypothetical protein [bacterium]
MIEFIKEEEIQPIVLKILDSAMDTAKDGARNKLVKSINPLFCLAHLAKVNMSRDKVVSL